MKIKTKKKLYLLMFALIIILFFYIYNVKVQLNTQDMWSLVSQRLPTDHT